MSFLVTCKELPEDAIHTAQFIEHFDALFNTFNSQRIRSSQRLGHAFSDSSGHYAFLQDMIKYLTTVNAYEGLELPCIYGWKLSINALFGLWHYLKEGYEFLLTSGLNQDCIENLFSIIHGKGGFRDNPDVQQFKAAFKYVWLISFLYRVDQVIARLIVTKIALHSKCSNGKIHKTFAKQC